jgi:hypothetical protein
MMEYMLDNPRTLFVLLLLTFYASLALSLVVAYRIMAMIRRVRRLAAAPMERPNIPAQPGRNLEDADICCPGAAPSGACSCH